MNLRPDVAVAAIIEREQRFLIVEERIDSRIVLNQPAGRVERGESLLAAVKRETCEETAWQFTPVSLVGIYLWCNPSSGRDTIRFTFTGTVDAHDPSQALDHPIIATHWLTHAELQARTEALRSPVVLRCIDDYLAGQRLPLSAIAEFGLGT